MINKDTIIRTLILLIALINQIFGFFGISPLPFEDESLNEAISLIFTISASLWAWWKNNSFTPEAIEADKLLKELKENGNK